MLSVGTAGSTAGTGHHALCTVMGYRSRRGFHQHLGCSVLGVSSKTGQCRT